MAESENNNLFYTFFILDASAIIHFQAVLPEHPNIRYVISHSVFEELTTRLTQYRFQVLEEKHLITYLEPSSEALNEALTAAGKVGSLQSLSQADIDVIALAIDLKSSTKKRLIVVTNDFSIQNVCSFLNIPFQPTENAFKIKDEIEWTWICR
ncbi:MAG: hypothetical protein ACFFBD_18165, partial [Candidatus Hodarchaeota archaeon]